MGEVDCDVLVGDVGQCCELGGVEVVADDEVELGLVVDGDLGEGCELGVAEVVGVDFDVGSFAQEVGNVGVGFFHRCDFFVSWQRYWLWLDGGL